MSRLPSACLAALCVPVMIFSQPRTPQFDFGSKGIDPPSGFVRISPESRYTRDASFGLLTSSLTTTENRLIAKALGGVPADGLAGDGPIDFRVDLPRGSYVVEVMMDGGLHGTWRGEISVNGKTLATSIESFGYSAESEYAPPYWACLRLFKNESDHMILRVHASRQRTTIAGVAFYPYTEGPIGSADGVFVRTSAAGAPNFDLALKLINTGKTTEATRIIDALPSEWNIDRAFLLLALASKLETQTPRQCVESALAILSTEYARTQDQSLRLHIRLAELWLKADQHYKQAGWQWARDLNDMGIFGNVEIAGISSEQVASVQGHPLWLSSVYQLAKTCYWIWVEQHVDRMIHKADSLFKMVQALYPAHPLINAYLGVEDAAPPAIMPPAGTPLWAALQYEAVNRMKHIIHYWSETRQASNGEFGGKFDDDVEMLRWWPFARVALDDSTAARGIKRIVDGIWNSDWISNGWGKRVRDVEHSSEPVADTQPMMIGFEYGNPVYVERCMQSAKLALELWTAKNSKGHRHFKSSWYSSTEVDATPPKDCDVPYNTRTVKAIRWFAWYTRHPEALRFLREWADSWLEDCMRTEKGKPAGVVPAAIRFSDDAIGGHADNWHHPGLFWDYFNYRGGDDMLMEFLSCYRLFGDRKYLKPIELSLELVEKHMEQKGEVGSEAWSAAIMRRSGSFWDAVEIWRLLTGDSRFDKLLLKTGSPYLKYRLRADIGPAETELRLLLRDVHRSYELITTEGYFTDRIDIRDLRGKDNNGVSLIESMYLGAPLADLFYPFGAMFWKRNDSTFSALVQESSPSSLRFRVFNHSETTKTGEATFLQLEPGEYEMVQGPDVDSDGKVDHPVGRDIFELKGRNPSRSFSFAPRTEELIVLRQAKSDKQQYRPAADLAIAASEVVVRTVSGGQVVVTIPVHNIGVVDAVDVTAELVAIAESTVIKKATVRRINAPHDLVPKQEIVSFTIPARSGRYRIRVSGSGSVSEITLVNNTIEFVL